MVYTKQALKDKKTAIKSGFAEKIAELICVIKANPYSQYPPYEKLIGDLKGAYSRRISRQHRLVYQIYDEEKTVKIISLWNHYE